MSAYVGKSRRIKDALVALLEGVTYDKGSGAGPAFQKVLGSNWSGFDGYPVAQVLPGREATSRPTTGQADKTPDYIVRIRLPLEDTEQSEQETFDYMYDLSDLVIDAIHDADQRSTLEDGRGPLDIYQMDCEQGDWLEVASDNGSNLFFDINVTVSYSKDLY